jgi:hypothetical protein
MNSDNLNPGVYFVLLTAGKEKIALKKCFIRLSFKKIFIFAARSGKRNTFI